MKKTFFIIFIMIFSLTLIGCQNYNHNIYEQKVQSIKIGEKTVLALNIEAEVEWSSNDPSIATVDEKGVVTGINGGMAIISAKTTDKTYTIYISVDVDTSAPVLELTGKQTIFIEEETKLSAKLYNSIKNPEIIWESSDPSIATVDSNGVVKGVGIGIVTIKAKVILSTIIEKEIIILVRSTNNILEDTVNNYIEKNSVVIDGELDLTSLSKTTVDVVEKNYRSTIGVSNYTYYYYNGKQSLEKSGIGTGVIFKREKMDNEYLYYLVTNYHVIKGNHVLKVYLGDIDKEITANQVVASSTLDLAVLTFRYTEDIPLAKFGNMEELKSGQFVIALGNPNGYEYYGSATFGMISYVNRKLSGEISNFIQHDAAINPGNSGGPLFNLKGEIIGINTIKLADEAIDNMGFSIALDTILKFLSDAEIAI